MTSAGSSCSARSKCPPEIRKIFEIYYATAVRFGFRGARSAGQVQSGKDAFQTKNDVPGVVFQIIASENIRWFRREPVAKFTQPSPWARTGKFEELLVALPGGL